MEIKYQKLSNLAKEPSRGSAAAAGYDLYAATDSVFTIPAHSSVMIPTDLSMELPDGYFGAIFARSGLASKKGLRPANCVGVIDSDYRGNIKVCLHNDTDENKELDPGDRIAQLVLMPYIEMNFIESEQLEETGRGDGGFGSTGK